MHTIFCLEYSTCICIILQINNNVCLLNVLVMKKEEVNIIIAEDDDGHASLITKNSQTLSGNWDSF